MTKAPACAYSVVKELGQKLAEGVRAGPPERGKGRSVVSARSDLQYQDSRRVEMWAAVSNWRSETALPSSV